MPRAPAAPGPLVEPRRVARAQEHPRAFLHEAARHGLAEALLAPVTSARTPCSVMLLSPPSRSGCAVTLQGRRQKPAASTTGVDGLAADEVVGRERPELRPFGGDRPRLGAAQRGTRRADETDAGRQAQPAALLHRADRTRSPARPRRPGAGTVHRGRPPQRVGPGLVGQARARRSSCRASEPSRRRSAVVAPTRDARRCWPGRREERHLGMPRASPLLDQIADVARQRAAGVCAARPT